MEHPLFYSLGDILALLEALPGNILEDGTVIPFNRKDFLLKRIDADGKVRCIFDEKIYSKLVRKTSGFLTGHFGRRTSEDARIFCDHISRILAEKEFYCNNDMQLLSHLFLEEFPKLLASEFNPSQKQDLHRVRNFLDYPFIGETTKMQQMKRIQESLYWFLLCSIPDKEAFGNTLVDIPQTQIKQYLLKLSQKYSYHQTHRGDERYHADAYLWCDIPQYQSVRCNATPHSVSDTDRNFAGNIVQLFTRWHPEKAAILQIPTDKLAYAKRKIGQENVSEPHRNPYFFQDPQGTDLCLYLKYDELIACRNGIRLTRERFHRQISYQPSLPPPELMQVIDNPEQYRYQMKIDSIKCNYLPHSHQKVHIGSFTQLSDPGNESAHQYYYTAYPIDYFDHLIFRKLFNHDIMFEHLREQHGHRLSQLCARYTSEVFMLNAPSQTATFHLMAGCGTWVISSDGFLLVSIRGNLLEKPGLLGYSSAGSCEFLSHDTSVDNINALEADPFVTAQRELYEECNIQSGPGQLELVSFGIDHERYLQQFSFVFFSDRSAIELLSRARRSSSIQEQQLIAVPFSRNVISRLTCDYVMEPGAVVSLFNIAECYL